jgi:hypothetical protein
MVHMIVSPLRIRDADEMVAFLDVIMSTHRLLGPSGPWVQDHKIATALLLAFGLHPLMIYVYLSNEKAKFW